MLLSSKLDGLWRVSGPMLLGPRFRASAISGRWQGSRYPARCLHRGVRLTSDNARDHGRGLSANRVESPCPVTVVRCCLCSIQSGLTGRDGQNGAPRVRVSRVPALPGIGVAARVVDHLHSVDQRERGSGIGATCREISTRNASELGQGLRIINFVPRKHFGQVGVVPAATQSLGLETRLRCLLLLQQADG